MRVRHLAWIGQALVWPAVVVPLAVLTELEGASGQVTLVLAGLVWIGLLIRAIRHRRGRVLARVLGVAITAGVLLLLRPPLPGAISDDLAEALFRDWLGNKAPDSPIFLSVEGRDPSPELMRRLADLGPRVKPRSMAASLSREGLMKLDEEGWGRATWCNVHDRETGEAGTSLSISKLRRDPAYLFSFIVDGVSYRGTLNAGGSERAVVRVLGKWHVTDVRGTWVS